MKNNPELVRGGQGRSDGSTQASAELMLFCLKLAIAILLIVLFLNGCASDMHSGL